MVKLAPVTVEQFNGKMKELKEQQNSQFSCN